MNIDNNVFRVIQLASMTFNFFSRVWKDGFLCKVCECVSVHASVQVRGWKDGSLCKDVSVHA